MSPRGVGGARDAVDARVGRHGALLLLQLALVLRRRVAAGGGAPVAVGRPAGVGCAVLVRFGP